MKISLIINTAALDPWALAQGGNMFRSAQYNSRAALLRSTLSDKLLKDFDEVIVAGVFEEGEGYNYVEVAPRFRDRRDALWQREIGARHATGDILVFCHDDHRPGDNFGAILDISEPWDLLIPKRVHGITGATLINGSEADPQYMGGHCLAMKRWLWAEVPWTSVDTEYWDVPMTKLWRSAGAELLWSDEVEHLDIEAQIDET